MKISQSIFNDEFIKSFIGFKEFGDFDFSIDC